MKCIDSFRIIHEKLEMYIYTDIPAAANDRIQCVNAPGDILFFCMAAGC